MLRTWNSVFAIFIGFEAEITGKILKKRPIFSKNIIEIVRLQYHCSKTEFRVLRRLCMLLTAVQEKLETIPDEYMSEVYNYLELLQYKILYKKQHEESVKRFPNRRPDILKQPNFYMSPAFDEPLEDFKEYM